MPIQKLADTQTESPAPDVQPEADPVAQPAQFTNEGPIPKVGGEPQAQGPTPSDLAFNAEIDSGMHDPDKYRAACEAAGKNDKWHHRYYSGHTAASGWHQPYEGHEPMEWHLKKGTSASQALKDFIKGPTIADYRVRGVALEMDELRDDMGDHTFDALFGTVGEADALIPAAHRLTISSAMYTIPFADQMKAIAAQADAKRAELQQPEEPSPELAEREERPKQEEPTVAIVEDGTQAEREVV
jgi:hypothetical protein